MLVEPAQQPEDLFAGLLDHEVVERLANDAKEGEQGERRADDDMLRHRFLHQPGVGLVNERGQALVGHEQQHVVDRWPVVGLRVLALR